MNQKILVFAVCFMSMFLTQPGSAASIEDARNNINSREYAKALLILEEKAKDNDPVAQYYLAGMYALGLGVKSDQEQAFRWYQKSAAQGNVQAQYYFGTLLRLGMGGAENKQAAYEWLSKAANRKHSEAQYLAGYMVLHDEITVADKSQAYKWLEDSANAGNTGAQYELGKLYTREDPIIKCDYQKAIAWLSAAGENGNVDAMFLLFRIYFQGKFADHDSEKMLYWLEKAATNNDINAQIILGYFYFFGNEIQKDDNKAEYWLEKAALADGKANFYLGLLYEAKGDISKAFDCYKVAGVSGSKEAEFRFSLLTIYYVIWDTVNIIREKVDVVKSILSFNHNYGNRGGAPRKSGQLESEITNL